MTEEGSSIQAMCEGIRAWLPQYPGYEQQSDRSKTDRLLREHVNHEINQLSSVLEERVRDLEAAQSGDVAKAIERVRRKLNVIAEGLHESLSEGASSSVETVDDRTASRLYEYDLSILRRVSELKQEVQGIDVRTLMGAQDEETLTLLDDLVDGLSQDLFERDTLIEGHDEVDY